MDEGLGEAIDRHGVMVAKGRKHCLGGQVLLKELVEIVHALQLEIGWERVTTEHD